MIVESILRFFSSIVILGAGMLFQASTPDPSANVLGCTIWRIGSVAGLQLDPNCTLSEPWWKAWSSCPITPVHSDVWKPPSAADQGLATIPWVSPESTGASVVGHQYYGDRPLHTGGAFPDGGMAKVLWQFDPPVTGLTLTAHDLSDASKGPVMIGDVGAASTATDYATDWPAYMSIPTTVCWRVDLDAKTLKGEAVHASVVYIVVE